MRKIVCLFGQGPKSSDLVIHFSACPREGPRPLAARAAATERCVRGALPERAETLRGSGRLAHSTRSGRALCGVIWGSAASIAGADYTLLGAALLFLGSMLMARRLSINFIANLGERAPGALSICVESEEVMPIAFSAVYRLGNRWIRVLIVENSRGLEPGDALPLG
jgi:hypothetical protein